MSSAVIYPPKWAMMLGPGSSVPNTFPFISMYPLLPGRASVLPVLALGEGFVNLQELLDDPLQAGGHLSNVGFFPDGGGDLLFVQTSAGRRS
jgi:hypothetical protein